jgi:hypothetical protein
MLLVPRFGKFVLRCFLQYKQPLYWMMESLYKQSKQWNSFSKQIMKLRSVSATRDLKLSWTLTDKAPRHTDTCARNIRVRLIYDVCAENTLSWCPGYHSVACHAEFTTRNLGGGSNLIGLPTKLLYSATSETPAVGVEAIVVSTGVFEQKNGLFCDDDTSMNKPYHGVVSHWPPGMSSCFQLWRATELAGAFSDNQKACRLRRSRRATRRHVWSTKWDLRLLLIPHRFFPVVLCLEVAHGIRTGAVLQGIGLDGGKKEFVARLLVRFVTWSVELTNKNFGKVSISNYDVVPYRFCWHRLWNRCKVPFSFHIRLKGKATLYDKGLASVLLLTAYHVAEYHPKAWAQ